MSDISRRPCNWRERHQQGKLCDDCVNELAIARGELVLWKAAATLTPAERQTMVAAISELGESPTARHLRHLYERLTFEVAE